MSRSGGSGPPKPRRPRLRTVLLVSNVLVLALPLAGITLVRLYDSILIRQTEAELIVQGAALAAIFDRELEISARQAGATLEGYGRPALSASEPDPESPFRPAIPGLDLARHPVLPPAPPAEVPAGVAVPFALQAGERLEAVLMQIQRSTLAGLRLVDPNGLVLATSGAEKGMSLGHRPEVAAALHGLDAAVLRRRDWEGPRPPLGSISRGTHLRVVVAFPVRADGRVRGAVVLARTPLSVRQALYRDRRYFLGGGLVLLGAVIALAWWLAAMLGRPLGRLIEATERVRRGEKNADLPLRHPGTREVDLLSKAVAQMAASLERRADYIANFAANVSHEFKTPLTSIRGTVELLRDHLGEMSPAQLERFLSILEQDSARLDRLVDRLLELARADVLRPGEERSDLLPTLEGIAQRFVAEGMDIRIDSPPMVLAMAREGLESVVSNLIDNARRHGGPRVQLEIVARAKGSEAEVTVTDDGPGISEANQEKIFDRFFTTRRGDGGSGIGLSIVRSLVEAHHGRIEVVSRPGHTEFTLTLPRADPSSMPTASSSQSAREVKEKEEQGEQGEG